MLRTRTSKLSPGQKTPDFRSVIQDGTEISALSLRGKKYILFFYNHDGSETCTKEACNLRDNFQLLKDSGYTVIGVSEDSIKKHNKFISKFNLPYPIISDEGNALAKMFDIYGEKEFMGRTGDAVHRTTFVVNEEGIIKSVIHPVDSAQHAKQILESLNIAT